MTDDTPPDPAKPAHAAKQLVKSADKLATSAEQQTNSADRRTVLAADRTVLAAERTYAAWVRTGLAALAAGIGARALLDKLVPDWMIAGTGSVLVLFSATPRPFLVLVTFGFITANHIAEQARSATATDPQRSLENA